MQPDLVAEFVSEFTREWNRLRADAGLAREGQRQALHAVERQIANLVDAIANGLRAAGLQAKLDALEARRTELAASLAGEPAIAPALHPNLGQVYRSRVATLQDALARKDAPEALEAARALIDRVVIRPTAGPDEPPGIDLCGQLIAMLQAGGAKLPREGDALAASRATKTDIGCHQASLHRSGHGWPNVPWPPRPTSGPGPTDHRLGERIVQPPGLPIERAPG